MGEGHLINARWLDSNCDEDDIFKVYDTCGVSTWGKGAVLVAGQPRYYLASGYLSQKGVYAYPYSLHESVIFRLAKRLNRSWKVKDYDMTWFQDYNRRAMAHFNKNGQADFQAHDYWEDHKTGKDSDGNDIILPEPVILPIEGEEVGALKEGDWYIAIIGLYHLLGHEAPGLSALFIDLIDLDGNRIKEHTPDLSLWWGWEGMRPEEKRNTRPVRVDKGDSEPGTNISITWPQVIYGFHVNNVAVDRFSGIHIRYENDGQGNERGHHRHYIVLQKRQYKVTGPDPDPPAPPPAPGIEILHTPEVVSHESAWVSPGVLRTVTDTRVYRVKEEGEG